MLKENLSYSQKEKIVNDIFKDQASELRILKAENMIKNGKASTFFEACVLIKTEEDNRNLSTSNKTIPSNGAGFSEQEIGLYRVLHNINDRK